MRHNLLYLMLLSIGLAHATPPIAITVDAIENGLDPQSNYPKSKNSFGRGPGSIVMESEISKPAPIVSTEPPTVIAPIEFDSGKATIRYESLPILHSYGTALQSERLKKLVFTVAGHTDSDGGDKFNLLLSQRRAQAVQEYLVQKYEIAAWRLRVESYGETKPLVSNKTAQGKARNRRVEFVRISGFVPK